MSLHRSALHFGLAMAALLAGCAAPPPSASNTRLYAIDQTGAARQCRTGPVTLSPGKASTAAMTVGNDGGWCAISVNVGGQPYSAGLLSTQAAHGKVYVHAVGDVTRIDFTPDRGYAGPDVFMVTLLPGRPQLHVNVTVTR